MQETGRCGGQFDNQETERPMSALNHSCPVRQSPPTRVPTGRCSRVLLLAGLVAGTGMLHNRCIAEDGDSRGRDTAIALNYCRAAFHRIKNRGSKQALIEEQEEILNNLNLNGIVDEPVIKLYSSVLDEISQIQIAEKERAVIRGKHRQIFRRQLSQAIFVGATQLATAQVGAAARTGVNSWWDYRTMVGVREFEMWRVDKVRLAAVVNKSSTFLDAFWKLSRAKNIPDRWLVRDVDLERLAAAVRETDLTVRLRVLRRMERFMECYPPYWYYVARTQQQLGQLFAAAETYDKLADMGTGFFRKDDMLAAGLANRAVIQEYLRQPGADRTAAEALQYSTDVWQANLVCAYVLQRHRKYQAAEEAILRNLDVNLEREHSLAALVQLYRRSRDPRQLSKRLNEPGLVSSIPMASLIECLTVLDGRVPQAVRRRLQVSCYATTDARFGPDDIVCVLSPQWNASRAIATLHFDGRDIPVTRVRAENAGHQLRFANVADFGSLLRKGRHPGSVELTLRYPGQPPIRLFLERVSVRADSLVSHNTTAVRRGGMGIVRIRIGQDEVNLAGSASSAGGQGPPAADGKAAPSQSAKPQPGSSASEPQRPAVQLLPLEPIEK